MRAHSFLLDQFDEFYRQLLRLRTQAESADRSADAGERGLFTMYAAQLGGETAFLGKKPQAAAIPDESSPAQVRQTLMTLLERQALEVRRTQGDYAVLLYKEAQYVMAALADEVFLYLDWPGSQDWRLNILESQLFQSHHAGEEIFERTERLLKNRDTVYVDLAKIYLMAFGLGFEGKYRGLPDSRYQVAEYRRRLLDFVASEEPELRNESRQLFPEAYASTLDEGRGARLPYLRMWTIAFAVLGVLWLLGSHVLWRYLVSPMEPIIQKILS